MTAPLVGRTSELAQLDAALAPHSGCRVVVLSGEPGIGKTRLATEAVARVRDALVLEGRADPLGAANAYAPIVEAFGRCLRGLPERKRATLVAGLPDLGRLFVGVGAPPPAVGDPQLQKARLFEALAQLIERFAAESHVVLVLDDLHWADRATFELVLHLVRRLDEARVTIVATSRSDITEATEGFTTLLQGLRRLDRLTELGLGRLEARESIALAEGILGETAPIELVRVLERASGVPLLVETLVRGFIDEGRLVRSAAGWTLAGGAVGELPALVREMLAARIAHLDADQRTVIDVLAVAGSATAHPVLAAVSRLDEATLAKTVAQLRVTGLVVEDDSGADVMYGAAHPLVLEVSYAALGAASRRRMHRAFVDVLEARGELVDRLARHYRGAGGEVDATRAVEVLVTAGERALGLGADDEAAAHLAGAVALLRARGGESLALVLERLGVAWQRAGKGSAALAVWQEALPLVGDDAIARGRLYRRIGAVQYDGGQLGAAREAYDAALAAFGEQVVDEVAALHRDRALLFDRIGDIPALERAAEALAQVADRLGAAARVAAGLARARVCFARQQYGAASEVLAGALEAAGSDERRALDVIELAMIVSIERGDLAAVRAYGQRALQLALRLGSPASQVRAQGYLTTVQLLRGEWAEAERSLQTIATLARRYAIPRAASRGRGMVGLLAILRGDLELGAQALADARAIAADLRDDRYLDSSIAMGLWWLTSERDERGSAELDARLATPGDMRCLRQLCRGEIAASLGRTDEALVLARAIAAADPGPLHQACAARVEAAAHGSGELARAARARAAAAWTAAGMPFDAARDRMRAVDGVEGDVAIDELRACLAIFEALGASRWADRARKRLRELGVRPAPVRRPGVGGGLLSRRELEVARLYADGFSTAQVAERLVISPHTAATHLQRIYQRLGLNSRAALTRYLVDTGLL